MKIGLFGGSFDPIHKGHIAVAAQAAEKAGLSRVIFLPSGNSPHKTLSASPTERYDMTVRAVSGNPLFTVSDFETKKKTKCYSFETVTEFKRLYPMDELYFIIGDDEYASFHKWFRFEELLTLCRFLVLTRHGEEVLPPFIGVRMPPIPISSAMIRERLVAGLSVEEFLPEGVFDYIKKHKLYAGDEMK